MSGPKTGNESGNKTGLETGNNPDKKSTDAEAQAARERELRELIEQVEKEKSGNVPPEKESPHDFIERTMREKSRK